MDLDIRLPLGLLFTLMGFALLAYGVMTHGSAVYGASLNVNLNIIWGSLMLCFGALTAWFGRPQRSQRSGEVSK